MITALISGRTSNTEPNARSSPSMAGVGATDVRTLIAIARGAWAPPRGSAGWGDGGVGQSEQPARAAIAAMAISLGDAMNRIGSKLPRGGVMGRTGGSSVVEESQGVAPASAAAQ